jgi:hypothetical protein
VAVNVIAEVEDRVSPISNTLADAMGTTEEVESFITSLYRRNNGEPASKARQLSLAMAHPVKTWAAIRHILAFPIIYVSLPKSTKSKGSWLYESRRPWNLRGFISSYIELPTPIDLYWQGRSKQELRSRTKRAESAGLTARPIAGHEIHDAIAQVFKDRGWDERDIRDAHRGLPEPLEDLVCVGVFDSTDRIVGFCIGILTGNIVRALWSCTSQKGTARWICFSGYVKEANARGARFIIQPPPWALTGGNKIFAGHLGFVPARIRCR